MVHWFSTLKIISQLEDSIPFVFLCACESCWIASVSRKLFKYLNFRYCELITSLDARHENLAVKTDRSRRNIASDPFHVTATQRQINPNLNKMFEWPDARPIYFDCVPRRFDFIKGCVLQSTMVEITETYENRSQSVRVRPFVKLENSCMIIIYSFSSSFSKMLFLVVRGWVYNAICSMKAPLFDIDTYSALDKCFKLRWDAIEGACH